MTSDQKGIALFLVLWVLTLLSVIVGEFCHTMRTEVNITRNFKEETEAYYIALAGLNTAITELVRNVKMPQKTPLPEKGEEEEKQDKIEWRINADIPAIPFAQGYFKVKIENESGKININKADRRLLKMMLDRFDIEDEDKDIIADSVLDWRDKDNLHLLNGAEDDYYLSLETPYECKDGDLDSIEELLLVRGMTSEIFYGGLKEMITVLQDETPVRKIKKTVSRKKKFDFSRININAASPQMLKALPQMTDELVMGMMEFREEKDFTSPSELVPIIGAEAYKAIRPYITLKTSAFFTIRSVGMIEGSRTRQGVRVMVKIDPKLKNKYRLLQWLDGDNYEL